MSKTHLLMKLNHFYSSKKMRIKPSLLNITYVLHSFLISRYRLNWKIQNNCTEQKNLGLCSQNGMSDHHE